MQIIEKEKDLSIKEKNFFFKMGYVCVDTETTGLSYLNDKLCINTTFCEDYNIY